MNGLCIKLSYEQGNPLILLINSFVYLVFSVFSPSLKLHMSEVSFAQPLLFTEPFHVSLKLMERYSLKDHQ